MPALVTVAVVLPVIVLVAWRFSVVLHLFIVPPLVPSMVKDVRAPAVLSAMKAKRPSLRHLSGAVTAAAPTVPAPFVTVQYWAGFAG